MSPSPQPLRDFETRVRQLMLDYRRLRGENATLRARLDEAGQQLEGEKAAAAGLRRELASLRMAHIVRLEEGDVKEARAKINRMVREVDKCIALIGA
ncbi:MAG: hypothetical protein J6M53_09875 [Bacteroidaceae bacterium]|nr:hypothetical protein [Bacteroidaceae bacterium]